MDTVVMEWTPEEACRLQKALRLTNEAYAERLGCAPRTVAKWHANPSMRLTLDLQQALDTMLARAAEEDRRRFDGLSPGGGIGGVEAAAVRSRTRRLNTDASLADAVAWLDDQPGAVDEETLHHIEQLLSAGGGPTMRQRMRLRAKAGRREVADTLRHYYPTLPDGHGFVSIDGPRGSEQTSLVSTASWLMRRDDLRCSERAFALDYEASAVDPALTHQVRQAAQYRLGEILIARTQFVDAPIFRLVGAPAETSPELRFALDMFSRYALTWDLLESEVADVVTGATKDHALRGELLPTAAALLEPASRICAGGGQALCAFARRGTAGRVADYVLLVQERSSRVVNAAGRLATIPKCFHQPMTDAGQEVNVGASLARELEEELFGRAELDGRAGSPTLAAPMHPSRMSAPMRWLEDSERWDMTLTGFSLNAMTGNYELPALIAVHDDEFWQRFGGDIVANWEASRLRTYSSRDLDGLTALLHDPAWSNEGLVAFALGWKRLAELNPDRVVPPPFEIGVAS